MPTKMSLKICAGRVHRQTGRIRRLFGAYRSDRLRRELRRRPSFGKLGKDVKGATYAIQGFGNVGYHTGYYAHQSGAKVVAVSTVDVAIYNENGLDGSPSKSSKKKLHYQRGGLRQRNQQRRTLALDVDVLAPCALENQLTSENAGKVRAKIVVEGANGPTTPEADAILRQNGVLVVPDILANCGGVVVSYFEWVQNLQGYYWEFDEVQEKKPSSAPRVPRYLESGARV